MLEYNRGASDPFVLSGLLIGNGIVNETLQQGSVPEFAQRQGLVSPGRVTTSDWEAREAMEDHLGYVPNYYDYRLAEEECCGCSSYNYKAWSKWLLRADVAEALNVCGDAGFEAFSGCAAGCIDLPGFDHEDNFSYSAVLGRALQLGIRVTMYFGMQDTACNYVGGYTMVSALSWSGAEAFAQTPLKDLAISGAPMGKTKSAAGLTWMQVEAAGHMVPADNPAAAALAVATLTSHHSRLAKSASLEMLNKVDVGVAAPLAELSDSSPRHIQVAAAFIGLCMGLAGLALFRICPKYHRAESADCGKEEVAEFVDWPHLMRFDPTRSASSERRLLRFESPPERAIPL